MRLTKQMVEETRFKVSCPHCGVRAGQYCITPSDKALESSHQVRLQKYVAKLEDAAQKAKEAAKASKVVAKSTVPSKPKQIEVPSKMRAVWSKEPGEAFKHTPVIPPPRKAELPPNKWPWIGVSAVQEAMCPRCLRMKGELCVPSSDGTHPERIAAYTKGGLSCVKSS